MLKTGIMTTGLTLLAMALSACAGTMQGTKTHAIDADGVPILALKDVAEKLNLTYKESDFWGDRELSSGIGHFFVVRKDYPSSYWFNTRMRTVEFPHIVYDDVRHDLLIPLGMYNDMCLDMGRPELRLDRQGVTVQRPHKDAVKLDVPEVVAHAPNARKANNVAGILSGTMIVLDAGHGGKDPGAVAANGTYEKTIALKATLKTRDLLEALGATVLLTRDDDRYIELQERAEIANRNSADLFISIHANAAANADAHGIETLYRKEGDRGTRSHSLASLINAGAVEATAARSRGAKADVRDVRVLKSTKMEAVLVELGFLTNTGERSKLEQDAYLDKLAQGIAKGVVQYVQGKSPALVSAK